MRRIIFLALLLAAFSILMAVPREMVVVEVASGSWCPYCPGASMGTHDLLENGYAVAVIKNQNGDPYANTYSNARNSYYGITSYPTAKFDGTLTYAGGSENQSLYNAYVPLVNQRLAIPSAYTITAEGEMTGNVLEVDVTVTKVENDTNTGVVLHSSITESNIQHNWQGQTQLDNVNRLMSPNQNGTPVSLGTGESTTITLTFNLDASWEVPNLELVLWLQNVSSKEILQGKKYSVPGLGGAFPASHESIEFPQTYVGGFSTIPFSLYNFSDTTINATIASDNFAFIAETPTVSIAPLQISTIEINFIPSSTGEVNGTLTVTGNFPQHPQLLIPMTGYGFVNSAPVAEDVMVSGPPVYLQTLSGTYSYSDADGDEEGETEFSWHRIIDGSPQQIAGADEISYIVQEDDIGIPIVFGVTPKDCHGMPGELVLSEASDPIIDLPAPQNFNAVLTPPNTVDLTWEPPQYFDGRAFVGYRVFRSGLPISTITTTSTLAFTDTHVPDGEHEYWICSMFNNPMMFSDPSPSVFITVDSTSDEDLVNQAEFSITAMPNPFRSHTEMKAKTTPNSKIKFSVYNLRGQLVRSYLSFSDSNGNGSFNWDGKDMNGNDTDSGVYLYRFESWGHKQMGKIMKLAQ